jgi:hypothetical protein
MRQINHQFEIDGKLLKFRRSEVDELHTISSRRKQIELRTQEILGISSAREGKLLPKAWRWR